MSEISAQEKATFAAFERRTLANEPEGSDEGLGTVYERLVMGRYLHELAAREGLSRILEHPADGVTGVIGCNSLPLAENGRQVLLANPVPEALGAARAHWGASRVEPAGLIAADVDRFPFADNSFDLVWNFCIFERFARPDVLVAEMARVSRRYVLVMTQNLWNLGTGLHALYHLVRGQPWDHGRPSQMTVRAVVHAFRDLGLRLVERGPIDTPPWVDTWDMPMRGYLQQLLRLAGRKWDWQTPVEGDTGGGPGDSRLVRTLIWIEDHLPRPTAFWQTHHWYVLAAKQGPVEPGCASE